MEGKLLMRHEVPVEQTWDLSLIYPSHETMFAVLEKMTAMTQQLEEEYKGRLTSPEAIRDCLTQYQEILRLMAWTGSYTSLAVAVDQYNSEDMDRDSRVSSAIITARTRLSFIGSELAEADEALLQNAAAIAGGSAGYLKEILREKPHRLHPEAERVLAATTQTAGAPYAVYNALKLADMKFGTFEANGKTYPLGYSLFEDDYDFEPDTAIRRAAFDAFSAKLKEYENGTATAYNAYVQNEKIIADLRGFSPMIEKDLFEDHVTAEMYHRQIDLIMEKLAPHMRKYARLLQRVYHLEHMTFADLHIPLDPGYSPKLTIQKSREYVEEGLAILGEDYRQMIREAYEKRWFDFAQNQGKCTGGFCASLYGGGSFILLSWCGRMSDVMTIAHELGHAGHFRLCGKAQSLLDNNVSGYFIEAPSTMNELLMAHHLLSTSSDKRFRRWVLSTMISDTYFHNFVTHLLEAAYQREVYKIVEAGGSVQADVLSSIMRETLERFWGDAVEINPGAELTWMRQPHYYMGLYSYSYSAGLTIATQMCKRIEREGAPAVEDWKKVLAAGNTLDPVGLAALGGIDITTDAALLDTIDTIGAYIDEICRLTDEIGLDGE